MSAARASRPGPGEGRHTDLAARRAAHKAAYARGLAGEDETDEIAGDPKLRRSYREGNAARRGEREVRAAFARPDDPDAPVVDEPPAGPTKAAGSSTSSSPSSRSSTRAAPARLGVQAGGFVLGAIAYALVVNYLRWGLPGLKAFAAAKALNRVTPGPWLGSGPTPQPPQQVTPGPGSGGGGGFRPTALGGAA